MIAKALAPFSGAKPFMIMLDVRNVAILSSDITGHNRIGSRDRLARERHTAADRHARRPPTPLSPADAALARRRRSRSQRRP